MKLWNLLNPRKSSAQVACELFFATWHVCTRSVLRHGSESVSWIICADVDGSGELPRNIVAGGVCDNEPQAREAMRRHYELWTLSGPTAMRVLGRASW